MAGAAVGGENKANARSRQGTKPQALAALIFSSIRFSPFPVLPCHSIGWQDMIACEELGCSTFKGEAHGKVAIW